MSNPTHSKPRRDRRRRHLHRPRLLRDRPRHRRIRRSSPPSRHHAAELRAGRAQRAGQGRRRSARTVDFLAHGTTVVINALTERKGVKTALITTEGFRDTLEIARGNRPDFFNLHLREAGAVRAALSAPRAARPHRLQGRGAEAARPLRPAGDPRRLPRGGRRGGRHLLPAFLRQSGHEQAVLARGAASCGPSVAVVASHQITREWREYERTNTAVLSAYVQPIAERYLARLHDGLARRRLRRAALHHAVELRRRLARAVTRRSRSPWSSPARPPASGARPSSAG